MGKKNEEIKHPSDPKKHKHEDSREHKKRRKHDEEDSEDRHRKHKHRKKEKDKDSKGKRKDRDGEHPIIIDCEPNKDDIWRDQDPTMDGERVLATDIPTAASLKITSRAEANVGDSRLPSRKAESMPKRDEWMLPLSASVVTPDIVPRGSRRHTDIDDSLTEDYGDSLNTSRNLDDGVDFFSSLGTERKRPPRQDRPDPDKRTISSKELNRDFKEYSNSETHSPAPTVTPGGPGSQWRMMRLRRVYETAEEEGRSVDEVSIERFGSLQAFAEAKEERRILDEREGKRAVKVNDRSRGDIRRPLVNKDGEKKFMFTDISGSEPLSRNSSFRRPGGILGSSPMTPSEGSPRPPVNKHVDSLRLPSQAGSPLAQSQTPIPSVMTPRSLTSEPKTRSLSPSSLNKLQAKVIRAKLMNSPDAEKLEQEYEAEARKAQNIDESGVRRKVEVMPTLDARGKMYDVGLGGQDSILPGKKKRRENFETHDRKTGEVIRINPDDDTITLGEMLRQERMGAGMADQKNIDAQYARAIIGDGKFENDLEYMDDNAGRLGRQKMRSDAMKRQFAINDYKRTQKVLASCNFCYGEDDSLPKAAVIAMGTRVYLSCTITEELVEGHCLIVPIQHHLNMLEGDDDVWDETTNFMKCLMRMYAEEDRGVVFFETVLSLRKQRHTCIECVPVPWEQFDLLPGYFKESILASEAEWSQHKKLIDFSARRGGFRRAMVPNLPYFMVQFDYKGEKGYGHVIEGATEAQDDDEYGLAEGEKGGGEFPLYFAGEIIGNLLDIEPRKWRRPKRLGSNRNAERAAELKRKYAKFDWTGMI